MSLKWFRVRDGVYEFRMGEVVLAVVRRHDPPNNSHISIWDVDGRGNWSTLRDAKAYVEKRQPPTRDTSVSPSSPAPDTTP